MTADRPEIEVTVVFALATQATEIAVTLAAGATVLDALERSGIAARHPGLDVSRVPVGIFGKLAERGTLLADGDRVEIYRPLVADRKLRRQRRAARPKARTQ